MIQSESLQAVIEAVGDKIATANDHIPAHLEDEYQSWIDIHGLDDKKNDCIRIVSYQSAYNIFLKAALYREYEQSHELPRFTTEDYLTILDQAIDHTGDEAFDPSLLDRMAYAVPAADIKRIYDHTEVLLEQCSPAEYIGELYERILTNASRRPLGQFRTPEDTAELMAKWVVTDVGDSILDPGIGAGTLTTYAYREKRRLSTESEPTGANLVGVEKSPLSVLMAKVALTLEMDGETPVIYNTDFLEQNLTQEFDGVICNPPYTRHHELSKEYKYRINKISSKNLDLSLSKSSPLYLYFYIHAAKCLKPGGRASFITAAEFLETDYGVQLRKFLLENFHIRAMILFNREESIFDDADTTSCVAFLEKKELKGTNDGDLTKFIRVDTVPEDAELLEAVKNGEEGKTEWGFVNTVRQRDLDPQDDWDSLFDAVDIGSLDELVPFSEIADVDRGIATGNNDFFCLSESDRVGKSAEYEWEISQDYLAPIIRKASRAPHYTYTKSDWELQRAGGEEVWLLYDVGDLSVTGREKDHSITEYTPQTVSSSEQKLNEYLKYGESDKVGADESYLASNRNPWYVVDRREPPEIFYTYMSKQKRFILNEADALALNNMLYVYLEEEITERESKALLGYLNSDFVDLIIKRSGRTYSTGLTKVEPSELEEIPVVDPRELEDSIVEELADLFENLNEASRDDNRSESNVREQITRVLENELSL